MLSVLGKLIVNFTGNHIALSHTMYTDRKTWGICKGYVGGLCPRYGVCSIRTSQFPSYPSSSPMYWR